MSKPSGFRAMTPGISQAQTLAEQWGPHTAVEKKRAVLAFNKAASLLGLHAQAIQLMNCLLSFTRECDWEADSRPLAWPDNQRLMCEQNMSLATLKRALRRLAETGFIAFKDSPSGRRVGRRNPHTGKISIERTYGIDLSPLGIRVFELEEKVEAQERLQAQTRALAQQFTRDRKMLASYIESALANQMEGPWKECTAELDQLVLVRRSRCTTEILEGLCQRLRDVLERARTAYAAAADKFEAGAAASNPLTQAREAAYASQQAIKMSPSGRTNELHIQDTSQKNIRTLYEKERSSARAEQLDLLSAGLTREEGSGNEPERNERVEQIKKIEAGQIDPITLRVLCPEFAQWLVSGGRPTWNDVVRAVETVLKPSLQIPQSTWAAACRLLGRETAACAVALIYEKHVAGLIDSPGAYLNGMLSKAEKGQLRLPSSLFHWRKQRKDASSNTSSA
ncbi:hypothetical protein ASD00_32885 [Ensifer sp. Root31]|uniref:plasmid replication protein RepC n=1 Tax=Ensifer sp. Root31 TaxID=1736512 RepID=UPI00071015F9|nr:plasmid replication protein RepC [Ensifer sp. Root31]KQU85478.1 hypothetical protein ASD00_32885 [Ensifer sp. Root31]